MAYDPVMYIVVRGDLEMPPGKLAAQAGHAAVGAFLASQARDSRWLIMKKWSIEGGAKIVVRVPDGDALHDLHRDLTACKLPCALIEDAGHTVFDKPTVTCLGVGPVMRAESGRLGRLPLF